MAQTHLKRVEIRNLDLNKSELITSDGTLERSHNVRYGASGIENVYNFRIKEKIVNNNGFEIIHIHNNNYIAIDNNNNIHHVEISFRSINSKQIIEAGVDRPTLSIHHFGNTLMITNRKQQSQYLLKNDIYKQLKISDITPLDTPQITYTYKSSTPHNSTTPSLVFGYNSATETNKEYITKIAEITDADYIYGAFYMIFAYRLFDGSIIKGAGAVQALTESIAETGNSIFFQKQNIEFPDGKTYKYAYCKTITGCRPTITFSLDPSMIDNELVSSIVIFATRPEQIYDFNNLHSIFGTDTPENSQQTVKLNGNLFHESSLNDYAKKPFYEIDEIILNKTIPNSTSITLTWNKHFKDIEYNTLYTPSFSIHDTLHEKMIEYNGRLHTFCQTTRFYNGVPLTASTSTFKYGNTIYNKTELPAGYALQFTTIINLGTSTTEIKAPRCTHYYYHDFNQIPIREGANHIIPINNFVSYPDHRAESINIYLTQGGEQQLIKQLPLTSSMANNIAYYNNTSSKNYASADAIEFDLDKFIPTGQIVVQTDTFTTKNKIMVSLQNNPFVFEPKNCYDIETEECEIYSLTTSADQITETSFGQHPLLIFTSKGIFAMEQGSGEVLYSRTILLSKDKQYPFTQNITIEGIVFYTTENEVRAFTSRQSNSVSKVLEPCQDRTISGDTILQFLKGANLCSLTPYDEIMLTNNNYPYAYTYSIKSNSWSTRSLSATFINQNTLIENGNIISTGDREDQTSPLAPHICTNALKLSTDALKKLEYLSPQLSTTPNSPLTITLWASNNLKNWYIVGSSEFSAKIGRCGSSWRYFKVEIKASDTPQADYYFYIWALDIKHTPKYKTVVD